MEFVEIMQEHSCEDTSAHIDYEMKQDDPLMGCPVHNLHSPDSCADGKAVEWCSQIEQEAYVAADQDISEHLEENSKLNINDENSSHNEIDVNCIDGEISKNKSPTMKNHVTHDTIKPHRCQTCGKEFVLFERLKIHMYKHTGIKKHKCEACGEEFGTFDTLKRHVEAHAGIKKNKCGTCGTKFGRSDHLKTHIARTGHKHKCMICSKTFTRSGHLKKHITEHITLHTVKVALTPHEFMSLKEEFVRFEKLKSHKKPHAGIKKHKCGICGKRISTASNLTVHMIQHTGLKKHKCIICSRPFAQLAHLKKHMNTHKLKSIS